MWDVREMLGKEVLDPLLVNALRLQPITFQELFHSLLMADDDDSPKRRSRGSGSFWNRDRAVIAIVFVIGLIAGIALVVRVVLLRRLRRFETTARMIAHGDLGRRVPSDGSDTISWLAREFNTMADSMTGLLDQVNGQQRRLETIINSIDDGIVVLDPERRTIIDGKKPIGLSRREFALLLKLVERPGVIHSKPELEEVLYGWQEEVDSNAVEVHIHNLRGKIGKERIETVRGLGYRAKE